MPFFRLSDLSKHLPRMAVQFASDGSGRSIPTIGWRARADCADARVAGETPSLVTGRTFFQIGRLVTTTHTRVVFSAGQPAGHSCASRDP